MQTTCKRLELPEHRLPGVFITFCGVDGSGKSSLIQRIERACQESGVRCLTTATPTPRIRKDPVFRELVDDPLNTADWSPGRRQRPVSVLGLLLSIMGDLVQHTADTVIPALEQGDVVLCDRYVYTTHAEIVARSRLAETQPVLEAIARRTIRPDVAFGLDVSMETSHERVLGRQDAADQPPPPAFLERQVRAYRQVMEVNQLVRLDTEADLEATSVYALSEIVRRCSSRLSALGRPGLAHASASP